jgi:SRSO17 transposase
VGGLAPAELASIRGRLKAFADDIFASLPRTDQRTRGQTYLRGLMLDGRRKSIQPMAARLGEVHRSQYKHQVKDMALALLARMPSVMASVACPQTGHGRKCRGRAGRR